MHITDIIFLTAEILVLVSYIFRNILMLRLTSIIASMGYVIGAAIVYSQAGMKIIILFSALTILVNLIQIFWLLYEKLPVFLPEHLQDIYKKAFSTLTTREFLKIVKIGTIKKYQADESIATQHQPILELMLIKSGQVNIIKDHQTITTLGAGFFIGEMSFLMHGNATADVIVQKNVEALVWNKTKLLQLHEKDASLYVKFQQVIALDLIQKVERLEVF